MAGRATDINSATISWWSLLELTGIWNSRVAHRGPGPSVFIYMWTNAAGIFGRRPDGGESDFLVVTSEAARVTKLGVACIRWNGWPKIVSFLPRLSNLRNFSAVTSKVAVTEDSEPSAVPRDTGATVPQNWKTNTVSKTASDYYRRNSCCPYLRNVINIIRFRKVWLLARLG